MNNHSSSAPLVHRVGLKRDAVSLTLECYSKSYCVQQIQTAVTGVFIDQQMGSIY